MPTRTTRLASFLAILIDLTLSAGCRSTGGQSQHRGSAGADLDRYLRVAAAVWLEPLALEKNTLFLQTECVLGSGLDNLTVTVLNEAGACDPSAVRNVFEGQLMLYNGYRLRCWEFNDPLGPSIPRERVGERIQRVLEWLTVELKLRSTSTGGTKGYRGFLLSGEELTGQVWFDENTGALDALDLSPR